MEDPLIRRWVDTWRRAGEELEVIRRRELLTADPQEVLRHLFSGGAPNLPPPSQTSGLVEQQAWFARLHRRRQ